MTGFLKIKLGEASDKNNNSLSANNVVLLELGSLRLD